MIMALEKPVILVGGGTGGHIFPLVAIGEELAAKKIPFIFVGSKHGPERQIVGEYGWQFVGISSGKYRRYFTLKALGENIVDLGRVVAGFFEAIGLLSRSGAPVVFSKGGYVALPIVIAAKVLGRTVIIHESDSVMGLTNRISARLASRVLTAFAPSVFPTHDNRYEQVGIPIRRALRQAANLKAPKKSRPLIFVLAGIQGSITINRFVRETLSELITVADIIHITGEAEAAQHQELAESLSKKVEGAYKPFAFISRELPYYYQSSDLIVTRASATVIAEAALFSKAAYLIPLPSSAADHQLTNAKHLQAAGAAVWRQQYQLTNEKFSEDIRRLLADRAQLQNLGSRLSRYFNEGQALERIIELIADARK